MHIFAITVSKHIGNIPNFQRFHRDIFGQYAK